MSRTPDATHTRVHTWSNNVTRTIASVTCFTPGIESRVERTVGDQSTTNGTEHREYTIYVLTSSESGAVRRTPSTGTCACASAYIAVVESVRPTNVVAESPAIASPRAPKTRGRGGGAEAYARKGGLEFENLANLLSTLGARAKDMGGVVEGE